MVRVADVLDAVPLWWWSHTATFYRLDEARTASGQVAGEWVPVEGLEDIPCAVGDVEAVRQSTGEAVETAHNAVKCYLRGYFPTVKREYRVSIDGGPQRVLEAVRHAQPAVATEVSWRMVD